MPITCVGGVVCCGNISFDMPVWPVEKFTWGTTLWVEAVEQSIGGNGGNTATALAVLGVRVRLYGCVGRDPQGDQLLAQLEGAGVETGRVTRSGLPTTCTVAIVHPSGDRLFLHRPGASTDVCAEMIRFDGGPHYTHFHLANLYTLPVLRLEAGEVLARAHAAGLTTSLDTGWDARARWMIDLAACLPHADLMFLNESEAENLTGTTEPDAVVRELRGRGARDVAIKLGERGSIVYWDDEKYSAPAYQVKVLDTTGAGDCFAGAFLAALHRGHSYPEAARFANAVGAMSVRELGTVKGVRSFEETERWMATARTVG